MEGQQVVTNGSGAHVSAEDKKELRRKKKQREYNRRYYAKKRKEAKQLASAKVSRKVKKTARNKKRRGVTTPARKPKKQVRRSRDERIEDAKDVIVARHAVRERTTDAIVWLREATLVVCSHCGTKQPRPSRQLLLSMLARTALEEG